MLQKLVSHKLLWALSHKKRRRQQTVILFSTLFIIIFICMVNERISFNMHTLIPINNSLKKTTQLYKQAAECKINVNFVKFWQAQGVRGLRIS